MAETTATTTATAANAYEKHMKETVSNDKAGVQIGWSARFAIFLLFPTLVGLIGLYMGYLETIRQPERKLDFDTDFVVPFLLAEAFAMVIAFQTRGFSTKEVEPLVKWPKVRRKKVIRKVRKEDLDEGDEVVEGDDKDPSTKKDD